jgi:hypothetical protein
MPCDDPVTGPDASVDAATSGCIRYFFGAGRTRRLQIKPTASKPTMMYITAS